MRIKPLLAAAAALAAVTAAPAPRPAWAQVQTQAQTDFHIKDGDRVVFYGDSITDSRQYSTMAETYITTRFPRLNVQYTHSGWGGDRVSGGGGGNIDTRLRRDVLAHRPTVVTIMLGMNDGSYRAFDQSIFNQYTAGYQKIIQTLKQGAPGVRITAILPSPFDDVTRPPAFEGGYNAVLVRYGEYLKDLAAREGLATADLNSPVVAMLQKANAADPAVAQKIIGDRVHPGAGGHVIMAAALLKAWKAPALVTAVELDGGGAKLVKAENTAVTDLKAEGGLTWTQLDGSLPFPIRMEDPVVALAVKSSDVVEQLNQQPLKVTGLPAAKYSLKIDETEVGTFTREELAAGINLAMLPTPMAQQAARVHALTGRRAGTFNERWRNFQVPLETDEFPAIKAFAQTSLPALLSAIDQKVEHLAALRRAEAQPVARKYALVAQG